MKVQFNTVELVFESMWNLTTWWKLLPSFTLFIAAILLAGCHNNPNVEKSRYLESGKRFSANGKYREAVIQFLNALKVDKNYPEAHYELAQTYEHLGQSNDACTQLARVVDLQPDNSRAQVELGNILFASGKTDLAQVQANAALAKNQNDPGVHALLSALADRRGNYKLALHEIHRALELDPSRAAFHMDLALLQFGEQTTDFSAEDELKKAITLDPKSPNARMLLAAFYSRTNRLQEAEKVSWDAVASSPGSLAARQNVAQVILKEGDQERAEKVLLQASRDFSADPQGVRILADYYASSGQLNKAVQEYSKLTAKYPDNASVQKGKIRVLLQTGSFVAARTEIGRLLKQFPRDPEVSELNGLSLLEDGKLSEAVNAFLESSKTFPENAPIRYSLGKAAMEKGDYDLAEKSFRESAELNPSERDAQEELAQIARQRGDLSLLADVADNTIRAMPDFAHGYVWRAIVELDRDLPDKAEADLKTALTLAPHGSQAYYHFAKLRFAQKRFPQGVELLEHALVNNPDQIGAMRMLVSYYLYQKQPKRALARLNEQIKKSPENGRLYDLLAQLELQDNRLDQAVAAAQKAMLMNPGDGEAVMLFVRITAQRGQLENEIAVSEKSINGHPNDANALATLGTLEEARGDLRKAEGAYRRSLQIQPHQPVAANNIAYRMLLDGENIDTAFALAQIARQAMPDSPNTADTLAWAYYHKGNYEFARNLLENALSTYQNSATMQYHLGMTYYKLLDDNKGTTHMKQALSLPHDPQLEDLVRVALQGTSQQTRFAR